MPLLTRISQWWRSQTRRNRRLYIAFVCLVVYTLTGFFLVPAIVKSQLLARLPALTHRQAKVAQVRMNPYALSLTIRGLELVETNGSPFVSWQELYINFQSSSLFRWAWTFAEITLKSPHAEVILDKEGRLNFANIFESSAKPVVEKKPKQSSIPRVLVQHLQITNGMVNLADLTRRTAFRTTYHPINLQLRALATRPNAESPLAFEAESDTGRHFSWSGNLTVQPFRSAGQIKITGIQLPRYGPYLEDMIQAEVTGGSLDIASDYRIEVRTNSTEISATNLTTSLTDLQVKDPASGEVVISLPSCVQREGAMDLVTRELQVGTVLVKDFTADVRRQKDGTINLLSLLTKRPASESPSTPPANPPPSSTSNAPWTCSLREFRFENGSVQFQDAALLQAFRTTIKPILVEVKDFTTRADSNAAVRVELTTEAAEQIHFSADAGINPVQARGSLAVAAVDLKKYQPYLAPFFRGQIAGGKTDLNLDFQHRQLDVKPGTTVSNLNLSVAGLDVKSPDKAESVAVIPSFKVEQGSVDLEAKVVQIGAIRSQGAKFQGHRTADGTLNFKALLPPNDKATPPGGKTSAPETKSAVPSGQKDWSILIGEIGVTDYAIKFEDQAVTPASIVTLDRVGLKLTGTAFPSNNPVKTELSLRVNQAGTLGLRGTAWFYTPAAEMNVDARGLELRAAQPYLAPFVRLGIASGNLNMQGQARFSPENHQGSVAAYKGSVQVTNLLMTDQVLFKEFVRWKDLAAKGIDLSLKPDRLNVEEVQWNGLKTSIIIGPDKKPNLQTLFPEQKVAADAKPGSGHSKPSGTASTNAVVAGTAQKQIMPITLPKFVLQNASFYFADQSIDPNCVFEVEELSGTVNGLSSAMNTMADVQLTGRVDAQSPFAVMGKANPLGGELFLDITVSNRNTQLSAFTPYMEKFAGYPLNKGSLTTQLRYEIRQKALKAENKIMIDQLTLGPKNDSPDATKVPLKLALALLKDREGRIELDLPLSGKTDDPQFKIGPILVKVLMNVLTKAVTSPFALLGALAGGGGEELSYIDFPPGSADVPAPEAEKLVKLSKALYERPALNLEILGSADSEKDAAAIKGSMLREKIRAMRIQELTAAGTTVPAPEQFQLDTNDYTRLVFKVCLDEFGTNVLANLSTNLLPALATNITIPPTNQPVAEPAPQVAEAKPVEAPEKGATLLIWRRPAKTASKRSQVQAPSGKSEAAAPRQVPSDPVNTANSAAVTNAVPVIPESTFQELEAMLLKKIEVSDNQLRELMQKRAQSVQAELLKTQKVTAERLFLIAPKPRGTSKGETRVNLSLN